MYLKDLYKNGYNIMQYLRDKKNIDNNDIYSICCAYDMQSGSYIKNYEANINSDEQIMVTTAMGGGNNNPVVSKYIVKKEYYQLHAQAIYKIFNNLSPSLSSILDAGTGEATSLYSILKNYENIPNNIYAVDISLSRLLYGRRFLETKGYSNKVNFATGNIFELPFMDSSIELVFTIHAAEPNTDRERDILQELYRVSSKYIVMIEPSYNLGTENTRKNIEKHKYIKNLYSTALELGYKIIEYRLFDISLERNNSELLIIEKNFNDNYTGKCIPYACPKCKSKMINYNNQYYCNDCYTIYPVIHNIPCLNKEYGIFCSKFMEF